MTGRPPSERCQTCGQRLPDQTATKYGKIADDLRERIKRRYLAPGDMLPSEHALMIRWGVSRITVRRALLVVEQLDLVEVVPGKGRRVK